MSFDLDQQALGLINAWEAGEYLHPAQKKAALQVAIRDALATPPAPAATDEEVDAASPVREQIHSAIRAFTSATVAEADAAALAIIRIIRNAAPRGVRWPPKGYERGQSGGFDGPTGAD